jgi:enamine deaminase RidA (YjgF/YER057c/UK114 family)
MSERRHHSSGTEWEARIGYARAIRVGDTIHVSGTLGVGPDGRPPDGAYAQAVAAFERIGGALEALGSSLADVVRTRMFVTDISRWEEIGRAHGEFFGDVRPATSMVQVAALIDPAMLVEIEADAVRNPVA